MAKVKLSAAKASTLEKAKRSGARAGQSSGVELMSFNVEATSVLGALRNSVASVLGSVGGVRKAADLQKSLKLDWTLSWQLFQVSGATGRDTLTAGAHVPSRTSVKKFIGAARSRGVDPNKLERVWTDYERFENLVEVHAGDRTSFNSMVSAAGGLDEEWTVADMQHRRNAFRSMSHVTGMQAHTKLLCGIMNEAVNQQGKPCWDFAILSGHLDLRMLRPLPAATVFRLRIVDTGARDVVTQEPLNLTPAVDGYLLEEFSTSPVPALKISKADAGWTVASVTAPDVGNRGANTLLFGTVYRNHPIPGGDHNFFNGDSFLNKPVEVLISDAMVKPGMMRGCKPVGEAFLGNNMSDAATIAGDTIPIEGNFRTELLGVGPDVMATPEVPEYPEMVRAAGRKLGWNVEEFEVWRLRVEFPIYHATIRMKWELK